MTAPNAAEARPGRPQTLAEGLRRILAPNPSALTGQGTNTYLLGTSDIAVIDPGPDDAGHLSAILRAVRPGQRITRILVTHAHRDHCALARPLARACGAPVLAYGGARAGRSAIMRDLADSGTIGGGEGLDDAFAPDVALPDGTVLWGAGWCLQALWMPGHAAGHMCFVEGGTVFTGDLVMGWASSLVSPPDGDLTCFMASCRRLRGLGARVLLPGHGAPVTEPAARIDTLIAHRRSREAAILDALQQGPATPAQLAARIYTDTPARLVRAAERNVLAHLIDLVTRGIAAPSGRLCSDGCFQLTQQTVPSKIY